MPQKMISRADAATTKQRLPGRVVVVVHAARRAHEAEDVERHEGHVEADQPAPERRPCPSRSFSRKPNDLREPVGDAGQVAEHHAADDHVVEVRHQEQAVVQQEVGAAARPASRRSCRRSRR